MIGKQIDILLKDNPEKQFFLQAFWRTIIEFNQILELSIHENYPLIMSENIHGKNKLKINTNKDEMRIYKIFLSKRLVIPRLESLEDLLRLKEDKRILPLKNVINDWNEEYKNHNDIIKIRDRIQKDFVLAEKEIKKLDKIKTITGIIGYVCIPVGIAELFTGTPISIISGGLSAIFSYFAGKRQKKNQWIHWGI